jgi:hypothetical protein
MIDSGVEAKFFEEQAAFFGAAGDADRSCTGEFGEFNALASRDLGFLHGIRRLADHIEHEVGVDSIGTWLLATSTVVAPIRFATKRCSSG